MNCQECAALGLEVSTKRCMGHPLPVVDSPPAVMIIRNNSDVPITFTLAPRRKKKAKRKAKK